MAAYETSLSAQKSSTKGFGDHRGLYCGGSAIVSVATAMIDNANDDVGAFWVEPGFVVTHVCYGSTDVDGGTALVIDIGDADDEDRLIAAATVGRTEGTTTAIAYAGFLHKYTARTQVRIYINTAAGTPATGTIKFAVFGFYDPEFSTTALAAA